MFTEDLKNSFNSGCIFLVFFPHFKKTETTTYNSSKEAISVYPTRENRSTNMPNFCFTQPQILNHFATSSTRSRERKREGKKDWVIENIKTLNMVRGMNLGVSIYRETTANNAVTRLRMQKHLLVEAFWKGQTLISDSTSTVILVMQQHCVTVIMAWIGQPSITENVLIFFYLE